MDTYHNSSQVQNLVPKTGRAKTVVVDPRLGQYNACREYYYSPVS